MTLDLSVQAAFLHKELGALTYRPASFVSRFWRRKTRFSSLAQAMLDFTVSIWICCEPGIAEKESSSVRTERHRGVVEHQQRRSAGDGPCQQHGTD